jgi:hypothetical protein
MAQLEAANDMIGLWHEKMSVIRGVVSTTEDFRVYTPKS